MKLRPYPGSSCFAYWVVASFGVCQPWGGESGRVQSNPTHFRQDNVCCKWKIVVASCSLFFSQRHQNICPWGISVFQHAQHGLHEPFNIRGCPPKNHSNSTAMHTSWRRHMKSENILYKIRKRHSVGSAAQYSTSHCNA